MGIKMPIDCFSKAVIVPETSSIIDHRVIRVAYFHLYLTLT